MIDSTSAATIPSTGPILGINFDLVDAPTILEILSEWAAEGERRYVTVVNPHSVMCAQRDCSVQSAIAGSGLILADGVGISLACRVLGYPFQARVPGPELMLSICDHGRTERLNHFFYGGSEGVADTLAERLAEHFPGLRVAGTHCPPFRDLTPSMDETTVERINSTRPDIVWVGLGTCKQERWMADHVGRINATALIGVGAAFDFHSGMIPRAPLWMRRAGLEWAHRLAKEPRRLWRRNLDSPLFLILVIIQRLRMSFGENTKRFYDLDNSSIHGRTDSKVGTNKTVVPPDPVQSSKMLGSRET